jgi:hypothetical protein
MSGFHTHYQQQTSISGPIATIARIAFSAFDWSAGSLINQIKIIPAGTTIAGEVGPHGLKISGNYGITVINTDVTPDEVIDVETQFDSIGNIFLVKSQKAKPFNGIVIVVGSLN